MLKISIYLLIIGSLCPLALVAQTQTDTAEPKKERPDLLATSTILASDSHWTIVPKNAAIYIPERYQKNVISKPSGSFLSWKKFFSKNAGWLHTHTVTDKQAKGYDVLEQSTIDAYKGMGKLIVATYHSGPISVHPKSLSPEPNK